MTERIRVAEILRRATDIVLGIALEGLRREKAREILGN
jgi:hypothetical protein